VANNPALAANGQAANKATACGTLVLLILALAALDGQPEQARANGTLAPLSAAPAAGGQTARLSLQHTPAAKSQFAFARASVRYSPTKRENTPAKIPEFIFSGA
jgi:hypothetical protein